MGELLEQTYSVPEPAGKGALSLTFIEAEETVKCSLHTENIPATFNASGHHCVYEMQKEFLMARK